MRQRRVIAFDLAGALCSQGFVAPEFPVVVLEASQVFDESS